MIKFALPNLVLICKICWYHKRKIYLKIKMMIIRQTGIIYIQIFIYYKIIITDIMDLWSYLFLDPYCKLQSTPILIPYTCFYNPIFKEKIWISKKVTFYSFLLAVLEIQPLFLLNPGSRPPLNKTRLPGDIFINLISRLLLRLPAFWSRLLRAVFSFFYRLQLWLPLNRPSSGSWEPFL